MAFRFVKAKAMQQRISLSESSYVLNLNPPPPLPTPRRRCKGEITKIRHCCTGEITKTWQALSSPAQAIVLFCRAISIGVKLIA